MTASKPPSVKKSQSAVRKHANREPKTPTPGPRTKPVTPASSPPFPQHQSIRDTSPVLPEYSGPFDTLGGFQGASPVTGPSSDSGLSSPPSSDPEDLTYRSAYTYATGDETDSESESDDMDLEAPDLPIRNGVYWDTKLNCEARPMSKPCEETINPGMLGQRTKCICGQLTGGKRVSIRHAKRHEYKGPKYEFIEKDGLYMSAEMPTLYTPFHHFKIGDRDIFQPVYISKEDYLAGARGPRLSVERSVPMCAHFPITGMRDYNIPFTKGRITHRVPNAQCMVSRTQDQARMLCLIEEETKDDGTVRRRMNIHAPPSDWNNGAQISALNRWRAQFRQRKLHITSRAARKKWGPDALNYIIERLARDPAVYRSELAADVSKRFKVRRTEHAVSCAIDNHKLRPHAEALRARWESEGLHYIFGGGDADIPMDDLPDSDYEIKEEEDDDDSESDALSAAFNRGAKRSKNAEDEEFIRSIKMEDWAL